ncbi:M50 family metallopeptidase [Saccharibacillus sp. CPCC 101409]|uniref:M50 family metallopeptidase n=1 Tax=Saccharibacillus sp. CPCC 101409 TaxID=3058041 RepID=UPI0026726053|nr:M50 family metallopeptidase [Saccharibacillus sp. CPCC 101409]MDO3408473.1 M50 family metallopeptidase [Saccharibacillus sp. CPCC 101409]
MPKWLNTAILLAVAAILTRLIPFSSLFRNLNTMIHEFGHAIVALATSGTVSQIQLNANHSGVTYGVTYSNWASILVSLSGYMLASLFAVLLFYGYVKRQQKQGLILVSAIALVMLVFYVHHGFGVVWLIGFIAVNVLMMFAWEKLRNFYYLLLCFLTLEESITSPLYLAWLSIVSPSQAGDAANLARSTFVPAIGWSILFSAFALLCAGWAIRLFAAGAYEPWRSKRSKPAKTARAGR